IIPLPASKFFGSFLQQGPPKPEALSRPLQIKHWSNETKSLQMRRRGADRRRRSGGRRASSSRSIHSSAAARIVFLLRLHPGAPRGRVGRDRFGSSGQVFANVVEINQIAALVA